MEPLKPENTNVIEDQRKKKAKERVDNIKKIGKRFDLSFMVAQVKYNELKRSGRLEEVLESIKANERDGVKELESAVLCPRCSSLMKKRSGKLGEFWGCTQYPECRGTRTIKSEIVRVTEEQKKIIAEKLEVALDYIEKIGGAVEARRWLVIGLQSLGEGKED